jgi:hypothetical protein
VRRHTRSYSVDRGCCRDPDAAQESLEFEGLGARHRQAIVWRSETAVPSRNTQAPPDSIVRKAHSSKIADVMVARRARVRVAARVGLDREPDVVKVLRRRARSTTSRGAVVSHPRSRHRGDTAAEKQDQLEHSIDEPSHRHLREFGVAYLVEEPLKPHCVKMFKLSSDSKFEEKFWDVTGLYLDPRAKRSCYAATKANAKRLNARSLGFRSHPTSHTHIEWLRFLKQIDRETPPLLGLHLIADQTFKGAGVAGQASAL